jgi:hypothetical protein
MLASIGLLSYGSYGLITSARHLKAILNKDSNRYAWKQVDQPFDLWYFGDNAKISYMNVWAKDKFIGSTFVTSPGKHIPQGQYCGGVPKIKNINVQYEYLEFMRGTEFVTDKPMAFPISIYYQTDSSINYIFDEKKKYAYYFIRDDPWPAIVYAALDGRLPFTILALLVGTYLMIDNLLSDNDETIARKKESADRKAAEQKNREEEMAGDEIHVVWVNLDNIHNRRDD